VRRQLDGRCDRCQDSDGPGPNGVVNEFQTVDMKTRPRGKETPRVRAPRILDDPGDPRRSGSLDQFDRHSLDQLCQLHAGYSPPWLTP